jgi:hypothetical protein
MPLKVYFSMQPSTGSLDGAEDDGILHALDLEPRVCLLTGMSVGEVPIVFVLTRGAGQSACSSWQCLAAQADFRLAQQPARG